MNNLTKLLIMAVVMFTATTASAQWKSNVFVGYNSSSGNTDKGQASLTAKTEKKWDNQKLMGKFYMFYSQSDNRMDGQKWEAVTEYAFDFGEEDKWFNTYKLRVDHDRFADIDYRILPSAGVGYHFAREEDWTWNADASLGYEITEYRSGATNQDDTVAVILGTFLKKKVLENAFISEDLSVIPGLQSNAGVRVKSETAFTNPLSENLDFEIKYLVDYDSEPAAGKTSTDKQIIAGVKYSF